MLETSLFTYNKFYSTLDKSQINNFTIYGERHSGTNWLEKLISKTFDIPITWEYGHKHFFGCCDWQKLNNANNTLFIGVVRNIYNWIGGMRKIPYHLESKDVINIKPWISKNGLSEYNSYCDSHWYTKEKYKDIFDMRQSKIEFLFLYMPYLVNNYIFIRYEDIVDHTETVIDTICNQYDLIIKNTKHISSDKTKTDLYKLPKIYISTINQKTKWTTENIIGYQEITNCNNHYRFC